MKKFILQLITFLVIGIALGEGIIRIFDLTIDVPKTYQAKNGLLKYYPHQEGNYAGGTHTWKTNKFGYAGTEPASYDDLVILLGDSYIQNFMNPSSCHQDIFLKEMLVQYNYLEAARAGASFLAMLEMSKELDSLQPELQLFYVKNSDFIQSLDGIKGSNNVRVNLKTNKLKFVKYKESKLKDLLYNFKFSYYCYRNIWLANSTNESDEAMQEVSDAKDIPIDEIAGLLNYVKSSYKISDKALIFSPDSDARIIKLCEDAGFKTCLLNDKNDSTWRNDTHGHWSCYGHKQVARQVTAFVKQNFIKQ